ncbi:MAG: hypothetical protein H5T84_08375 [Thermoleophilia bacterium]|nr:hypothetical protein [Thermoleophilia bacterium]
MHIGPEADPKIRVEGGDPFPVAQAEIVRDVARSYLQQVIDRQGNPVVFPPGARVTLYAGDAEVFVGRAESGHTAVDLLSAQADIDGGYVDI